MKNRANAEEVRKKLAGIRTLISPARSMSSKLYSSGELDVLRDEHANHRKTLLGLLISFRKALKECIVLVEQIDVDGKEQEHVVILEQEK